MFAIDHAATALLIKRRYPSVPIAPMLVAVQLMELVWVALNYVGIERTTTAPYVQTVADIRLEYMPYSHSVAMALGFALIAWLILEKGLGRAALGRAVAIGILSHLVLDLATHAHDIQLAPGVSLPKFGLGLYSAAPLAAFVLELAFGLWCWVAYRGSRGLLAVIVLGNVANISLFSAAIRGPEGYMSQRPLLVVTTVLLQIIVTLALVGYFARRRTSEITNAPTTARVLEAR